MWMSTTWLLSVLGMSCVWNHTTNTIDDDAERTVIKLGDWHAINVHAEKFGTPQSHATARLSSELAVKILCANFPKGNNKTVFSAGVQR